MSCCANIWVFRCYCFLNVVHELLFVCSLTRTYIIQHANYVHHFDKLCVYDNEQPSWLDKECRVSSIIYILNIYSYIYIYKLKFWSLVSMYPLSETQKYTWQSHLETQLYNKTTLSASQASWCWIWVFPLPCSWLFCFSMGFLCVATVVMALTL